MHDGLPCETIQGQGHGHGGAKVAKMADSKVYFLSRYACNPELDVGFLNPIQSNPRDRSEAYIK